MRKSDDDIANNKENTLGINFQFQLYLVVNVDCPFIFLPAYRDGILSLSLAVYVPG